MIRICQLIGILFVLTLTVLVSYAGEKPLRSGVILKGIQADEPVHVHVEREDNIAKVWLDPLQLQSSGGFSRSEINRILSVVNENRIALMEAWNEYFSD